VRRQWLAGAALGLALAGCATVTAPLRGDGVQTHLLAVGAVPGREWDPGTEARTTGPSLAVPQPVVRGGIDSRRMVYVARPYELSYFARNEWADTPARMLHPLLVQALEGAGAFRAVVSTSNSVVSDLRLDTEVLALQQEFLERPSVARVAIRAQLVDLASRRVLATRVLEAKETAPSDDPYGGVVALNQALARVLADLSAFAARASP
jgi:cholesterol transport system auxiliary component